MFKALNKKFNDFYLQPHKILRFFISALCALILGWGLFCALIYFEPVSNKASDLFSGLVYMVYDNISNRLFSLNVFFCFSFLVFVILLFSSLSLKLAQTLKSFVPSFFEKTFEKFLSAQKKLELIVKNSPLPLKYLALSLFFAYTIFPAISLIFLNFSPNSLPFANSILSICRILFMFILFGLWFFRREKVLKGFIFCSQFFVLFYFLLLSPQKFINNTDIFSMPSFKINIIAACLIFIGIIDVFRRRKRELNKSFFSPVAIFAILLGFVVRGIPAVILANSYEIGSRLPEYWMISRGWMSAFKDMYITYGLWDLASMAAGEFLFNGLTIISASIGFAYFSIIIMAVFFAITKRTIPLIAACILTYLIGRNGYQIMPCIYAAILLYPSLISKPERWIIVWALLSAIYPFARIPQGSLAVAASLPAVLYQIIVLYKSNKKTFYKVGIFGLCLAFVVMIYPFGEYFRGIIRIVSETAAVNGVFAGTPFRQVYKMSFDQMLHISMFFIMPMISVFTAYLLRKYCGKDNKKTAAFVGFFVISFCFLYALSSISYSFSRLWDLSYARYSQTIMITASILSIAICAFIENKKVKIGAFLFLLIIIWYSNSGNSVRGLYNRGMYHIPNTKSEITDGADFGVDRIGKGFLSKDFVEDEKLVKESLDKILDKDETFLDMTLNGLHYYVSDRKLWLEYPVYYVYPGNKPQRRAVEILKDKNIKVSLLDLRDVDDRININTRSYHLYRYALLNGLPWEISEYKTILMPAEYFKKIGKNPPDKLQTLKILDKHFPRHSGETDYDPEKELFFAHLPAVWGNGYKGFKKNLIEINSFEFSNKNPRIEWEYVFSHYIKGIDGGLLYIDILDLAGGDTAYMTINWINDEFPNEINEVCFIAHKGINLVPVEAAPRWLLADKIKSVIISRDDGKEFSVNEVKIFNRIKI
ncbi:MAG: hypothetical protein LBQ37_01630 [Elusimicrobiota bacterium]|jgi:hypothetical protein|nr:hypothetical protein [Elusimicrobiota bacterium]